MSVAKTGADAADCGFASNDVLHQAICRLYAGGITVVAAAANERRSAAGYVPAAYNQVITVSALADTDGRTGGAGGNRCYSWGSYDRDDTFADFSNYGSDVDLIAPGKCIWSTKPGPTYGYSSGTSMSAPLVTGAVALYKASRPLATPSEVREACATSARRPGTRRPTRIRTTSRCSRSRASGPSAASRCRRRPAPPSRRRGGTAFVPITVTRTSTFFERVRFTVGDVPSGWSAVMATPSLFGWTANAGSVRITVPSNASPGTYHLQVAGANWGRSDSTSVTVTVASTCRPPAADRDALCRGTLGRLSNGSNTLSLKTSWAPASDLSDAIVRYEIERSGNGGAWAGPGPRRARCGPRLCHVVLRRRTAPGPGAG